jgi:RAP1 GTPase activating protein 1
LAADDDFQALHGAVRILARTQTQLRAQLETSRAELADALELIRVQQTEITSLQRSFESFKVTTLGLHEDLTRELAITNKLVNARHAANPAGAAFADIDLSAERTASVGVGGGPSSFGVSSSSSVPAGLGSGVGMQDTASIADSSKLRLAAWASSSAAAYDSDSDSGAGDGKAAASSASGHIDASGNDTKASKAKRLKSPKGASAGAATTGGVSRSVDAHDSGAHDGASGGGDDDDEFGDTTPRGTKKKKTPRRKKATAGEAAGALVVNVGGYRVESGSDAATAPFGKDAMLMFPEKYTPIFKTNFLPYKHKNFVQVGAEKDPLVVTYSRKPGYDDELSLMLFTQETTTQLTIKTKKSPNAKELGQLLKQEWPPAQRGRDVSRLKQVKSAEMTKMLSTFEDMNLENKFKVSVVYMSEGQTTAAEMLSNIGSSLEFQKFLQLIGDVVKLENFAGFSGDLDTVEGNTGKSSVYSTWRGLEIMYHVATLLPYDPQDPQQVAKRKYLESNTAMIVFKDGPPALDPRELITDVTCVVIVVELVETATQTAPAKYRVAVVVKDGVTPFGPDMPRSGEFKHGDQLRDFILAKLINGVQASMELPKFREPFQQARAALLRELTRKS